MYANIENAIFQPSHREEFSIIHFHLKDHLLINNKRCLDLQICTRVVEKEINFESNRRSYADPDEIEEEQKQREVKRQVNKMFKDFANKIQKIANDHNFNIQFDVPFEELSFQAKVFKDMVTIRFCAECIIAVEIVPFFVLPLKEIEHIHFERVAPRGKNFDMV